MTAPDPGDTVRNQQAVGNGSIETSAAKTFISANNRTSSEVELWKTGATGPGNAQRLFPVLPGDTYPSTLVEEPVKTHVQVVKQTRAEGTVPTKAKVVRDTRLNEVCIG